MADGINSDKVNINLGEGGGGGGSMAAVIAALGNRNQGNDNAALIAALGNRNDGHRGDDGFGGSGMLGLVALLALLRGRGGIGGGDDCGSNGVNGHTLTPEHAALVQSIMNGINGLTAAVPTVALETQAAIQRELAALALGTQQGFANTKDAVQNTGVINLVATKDVGTSVTAGTLATQIAISNDGDKTRALIVNFNNENLQRQLTVAQSALLEERTNRHSDGVKVEVQQTVNQAQQQAQFQQQQQAQYAQLFGLIAGLGNQIQAVRSTQDIVNLGTMTASGTQAQANTQVR